MTEQDNPTETPETSYTQGDEIKKAWAEVSQKREPTEFPGAIMYGHDVELPSEPSPTMMELDGKTLTEEEVKAIMAQKRSRDPHKSGFLNRLRRRGDH